MIKDIKKYNRQAGQGNVRDCTREPQQSPKIYFRCTIIMHQKDKSLSFLKNR